MFDQCLVSFFSRYFLAFFAFILNLEWSKEHDTLEEKPKYKSRRERERHVRSRNKQSILSNCWKDETKNSRRVSRFSLQSQKVNGKSWHFWSLSVLAKELKKKTKLFLFPFALFLSICQIKQPSDWWWWWWCCDDDDD